MTRKYLHYAVDLDGTLAVYDRWRGHNHIGEPIPRTVARVKQLLADGHYVTIFTARMAGSNYVLGQAANAATYLTEDPDCEKYNDIAVLIEEWCRMHIGQVLPITAEKKPYFHAFLDDRAEQIIPNDGRNAALAYRRLVVQCLTVMESAQLDPVILKYKLAELDTELNYAEGLETP